MAKSPPDGSPQIIPYLYYEDADAALEFMQKAFGFEIESAFRNPNDGRVLTSTLRTGSGKIMVGPGMKPFGTRGTPDPDQVSSMLYVFVDDVDAHYGRAKAAGAQIRAEPHVHFGGNRQYTATDPGGQRWTFAQPVDKA
jgi:uncharacterized glyoxalase superfamily protein PhnB